MTPSTTSTDSSAARLPTTMRALVLAGPGLDRLAVRRVPLPRPGPEQLLMRVECAGICTSLLKLTAQGADHSLMYGWDVAQHPLILGDEGCVTVAAVGEGLAADYRPGGRFVIQPAVDHPPLNHRERYRDGGAGVFKLGVGYTLPGHLAEYMLVTEETLRAGCLLPLPDGVAAAHAAMAEPFSCVVSAQDHHLHLLQAGPLAPRTAHKGLRRGGVTVVVGAGAMGRMHVDLALASGVRALLVSDMLPARLERVRSLFAAQAEAAGVLLRPVHAGSEDVEAVVAELSGRRGADDVIVAVGAAPVAAGAQRLLGRGGVLNLFGGFKSGSETVALDGNRIHYRETVTTGSSGGSPWDLARTLELIRSGEVDMAAHITRVGDLEHAGAFLTMIEAQQLDGKAVVYPHRRTDTIRGVDAWSAADERSYLDSNPDSNLDSSHGPGQGGA